MKERTLELLQKAEINKRSKEPEGRTKEERLKQIQLMRERLNQHTADRARDVRTISENTKNYIRAKETQAPTPPPPAQERGGQGMDR